MTITTDSAITGAITIITVVTITAATTTTTTTVAIKATGLRPVSSRLTTGFKTMQPY